MTCRTHVGSVLLVLAVGLAGCDADRRPGPSAPSPSNTPPVAPVNPPFVSAVFPATGSAGGGTAVTIKGSGFQTGAAVTLGAIGQTANVENSTTIRVTTSAHDPGPVEIIVTNPDGQTVTFTGGYSYASAQSFDFNGAWEGHALAHPDVHAGPPRHADMDMQFIIERNMLRSVMCGGVALVLSPTPSVTDGAFSYSGNDGVLVTGRIVSDGSAVGTINTTACPSTRWAAGKQ
jgi:IPT/TIG domain